MSAPPDSPSPGRPIAKVIEPTFPAVMRSPWFLGFVLVFLTMAVAAPFFNVPLPRDQGVYAACGNILLHGGAPYEACWDTKGPLTHYTYTLAQLLFGINLSGPNVLSAFMVALTGLSLWRLARRWWGEALGWSTGLLYALLLMSVSFDMNAQPETFANLFIVGGVWAVVSGSERNRRWLYWLAGSAFAVAIAYKYSILLPVAAVGIAVLFISPQRPKWSEVTRRAFDVGLGFCLILAAFASYLWMRGVVGLAVEHVVFMLTEFPKAAVNLDLLLLPGESGPPLFYWQRTVEEFLRLPIIFLTAFVGCGLGLLRRRPWAWLVSLWAIAAIASVYPQKVMSVYHWTLALAPLILGVGSFIWELQTGLSLPVAWHRSKLQIVALFGAMALLILANLGVRFYQDRWLISAKYLSGQETLSDFYADQGTGDEIKVADYIRDRTTTDDLVWVWGNHAIINYWADRRAPTRFIFNSPIVASMGPNDYQPRWTQEVLEALQAHPPTYLVMTYWDRTWFDYENPYEQFAKLPGYQNFLDRYYRREIGIDRFVLFRLTPWWSRYNYPAQLDTVSRIDLLSQLSSATLTSAPNQPIHVKDFKLHDEAAYPTLLMPVEGKAVFNLTLPDQTACFRADLAMDPQSWGWGGDGATFNLAINGQAVFEQYVGNTPDKQFWQPVIVDLSQWAGQAVRLALSTGPGPKNDFTGDLAGWGLPRIVQSPGSSCDARAISP
jgi:Dolichyl-phosphate-mannose-protein mannosyltransferase